ncbi:hypothetical protein ACJX0J_041322 [Zea mays]
MSYEHLWTLNHVLGHLGHHHVSLDFYKLTVIVAMKLAGDDDLFFLSLRPGQLDRRAGAAAVVSAAAFGGGLVHTFLVRDPTVMVVRGGDKERVFFYLAQHTSLLEITRALKIAVFF